MLYANLFLTCHPTKPSQHLHSRTSYPTTYTVHRHLHALHPNPRPRTFRCGVGGTRNLTQAHSPWLGHCMPGQCEDNQFKLTHRPTNEFVWHSHGLFKNELLTPKHPHTRKLSQLLDFGRNQNPQPSYPPIHTGREPRRAARSSPGERPRGHLHNHNDDGRRRYRVQQWDQI